MEKKPIFKRWWFIALIAVVAIGILANLGGRDDETAAPAAEASTAAPEPVDTSEEASPTEVPAEVVPAEAEEEAPEADVPEEPTALAGIGEPVTSGDLELTVVSVSAPVTELGNEVLGTQAQGEFILIELAITNNGNQAENFYSGQLKLKSGEREFEPDSTAAIYLPQNSAMLFDSINPGNTLKGSVVFDLPAGTTLEVLEFRGGIFSSPAQVALS